MDVASDFKYAVRLLSKSPGFTFLAVFVMVTGIGLSVYLCMADYFAIYKGIWSITSTTRTGWGIGHLPVEEMLFFTLTNLFVLQGLCLWRAWRRDAS